MSTKKSPPQNWYAYVQNNPVNLRDLWGLTTSDRAYENVGITFLPGDDNAIYVASTNTNPVILVATYDGNTNLWGASTGTLTVYENYQGTEFDSQVRYPVATVPIVSGGNGYSPCEAGAWMNLTANYGWESSNPMLSDDAHGGAGAVMIRIPDTDGNAIHQGNNNAQQEGAYTEGCIGVTGDTENTANENMKSVVQGRITNSNDAIKENIRITVIVR